MASTLNPINPTLYYQGKYPDNHFLMQPYVLRNAEEVLQAAKEAGKAPDPEEIKVIAIFHYKGKEYSLYCNPTDSRGFRMMLRMTSNKDNHASTVNRHFTQEESDGLYKIVVRIQKLMRQYVPVLQVLEAGNNSHVIDPVTGKPMVGSAKEANMLHDHLISRCKRGDAPFPGLPDLVYEGPEFGQTFDMMGQTKADPTNEKSIAHIGNDKKIPWTFEKMAAFVKFVRAEIEANKANFTAADVAVYTVPGSIPATI